MTALHLFDMDGTLLLRSSASLEIGRRTGHLAAIEEYETAAASGAMDNLAFARSCHPLWQTLTEADIAAAFDAAPWIEGVRDVWADIEARGEHSAVVSMSPLFFVERLLDWGVGSVHATDVAIGAPLDPGLVLTHQSKAVIAAELCEKYAVPPDACVAYGDSLSDIALFQALRNTVAVNGDERIRSLARLSYQGTDLRAAYRLARTLLDGPRSDREDGAT
ncbi:HAD family hydrolase [Streptomyces tremellae]|uniref:Hydrolase n=1 Tax=Streptomyces tremellae TaxID=1124239 RepID=A0ABP7G3M0_9ACTN